MVRALPNSGPANRPKPPMNCPNYDKGEVQKSRTAQGHLTSDVIVDPRGLLIADFEVDVRTSRESLKRSAASRRQKVPVRVGRSLAASGCGAREDQGSEFAAD
jgi:hypothetical protein